MRFLLSIAWRDLRATGSSLWVFCVCLALGVALVMATGGLYRQVSDGLLADTRALMGGDLEVETRAPLPEDVLAWMNESGTVARVTELDTMLGTASGNLQRVQLQSVDDEYPLYGALLLEPHRALSELTELRDGHWGIAVDPALAEQMNLRLGDRVTVGTLAMAVRALIRRQPDRSLRAEWRGLPVLIADGALAASGLLGPASRVEYEYRVRTADDPDVWRERFYAAFPDGGWEVNTLTHRSERITRRLGQIASGLLIIGFSTLFIGGLGIFNSIQAYLQGKLRTIATLRALGLRNRRLAAVYLLQVGMLAGLSCLVGAVAGFAVALAGTAFAAAHVPVVSTLVNLVAPVLVAIGFGLLTAFTFAMPAVGRALSIDPAALFRGIDAVATETPRGWWLATLTGCALIAALVLLVLPDPLFGLGFIAIVILLLGLLDLIVRGLRRLARALENDARLGRHFALRLAIANLYRPGSPLRTSLLSLGSALTLLVTCAIVVGALLRAVNDTIPEEAPALVLYDIADGLRDDVVTVLRQVGSSRIDIAPLIHARLSAINGERLGDSADTERRREARDEHKLTYRAGNIDSVTLDRGNWWDEGADAGARVVMEDHEADQLGLEVGDHLTFTIQGQALETELTGIYRQKGMQTRFWFEAILSDGALDPFIYRHVGAAYMSDEAAKLAQKRIAAIAPNVVSVRTATMLETARRLLGRATAGLAVVALVSLTVSLLVLASVMATARSRQIYDATILHSLGARLSVIRHSLQMEYLLLAVITSLFAIVMGSAIAVPLLEYRLKLPSEVPFGFGVITAVGVSSICLYAGARYLLHRLRLNPALLLRSGG